MNIHHFLPTNPPGRWGVCTVDTDRTWAIIGSAREGGRLRVKRIGPVYRPGKRNKINYFDRAMEEAKRRNQEPA